MGLCYRVSCASEASKKDNAMSNHMGSVRPTKFETHFEAIKALLSDCFKVLIDFFIRFLVYTTVQHYKMGISGRHKSFKPTT